MNQNDNQIFEIVKRDIKSHIEIQFNEMKKCYEIKIVGDTDVDKDFLKINHFGSGLYNVNPKRGFAILDGINKMLSLIKIKNDK